MPGHGREVAVIPAPGGKASGDSLDQLECLQVLLYVLQAQGRDPGSAVGEHHHKTLRCEPHQSFADGGAGQAQRSEEHTSELQSLMRISYAVFCLKTQKHAKPQEVKHITE